MSEKSDVEKLRILLPHWIEHNHSHIAEFVKWQEMVGDKISNEATRKIAEAVEALKKAGSALEMTLAEMGGGLEGEGHHHHHH